MFFYYVKFGESCMLLSSLLPNPKKKYKNILQTPIYTCNIWYGTTICKLAKWQQFSGLIENSHIYVKVKLILHNIFFVD